ncbi:MAG: SCO family protein [Pseudomonadota bacterium]
MDKRVALFASVIVVAFLGGMAGLLLFGGGDRDDDQYAACRGSAIAGGAGSIGGPFELLNHEGATVTDADVITKPSLLYFGFTFCPDVCPLDVSRNSDALVALQEQGRDVQGVFISIDPERDTPEVVGEYADLFYHTVGLTGSPEQVKAASRAYKTYYQKEDTDDEEFYLIAHSTQTYLVLPDEGFVDFFRRTDSPEAIAETVSCYMDAA